MPAGDVNKRTFRVVAFVYVIELWFHFNSFLIHSNMDQSLDLDAMTLDQIKSALDEAKSKLDCACRQIAHLDNQISYLRKLFRRAEKNKGYAVRYNLRMQLSIVSGVKVMYHHYAAMKEERIARLRLRVDNAASSQQIPPVSEPVLVGEPMEQRTDSENELTV